MLGQFFKGKLKERFKGFISGVIITTLITTSLFTFADVQSIQALFNDIKIQINGKIIDTGADKPFIYNGRTYVPTRYVAEGLGATVKWNESSNTVEISNNNNNGGMPNDIKEMLNPTPVPTPTVVPTAIPTPIPTTQSYVFRKTNFGMTKSQVVSGEGKQPDKTERNGNLYAYENISISAIDSSVLYCFNESNQLCEIYVFSESKHTNKNDYIYDYDKYVKALSEKFGNPKSNNPIWKNSLYKDDTDQWGFAVSLGHLSYLANWDLQDIDLGTTLNGDNYKITLGIIMKSKTIAQVKEQSGI